jgi:hypothetical protein
MNASLQRKLHVPVSNDLVMIFTKEMMNHLLAYSRDVVRKKMILQFGQSTSFAQWLNEVSNMNTRPTTDDVHLWHVESKITSILAPEDISLIAVRIKHIPSKMTNLPGNLTVFEKRAVSELSPRKRRI